MSQLKPVVIALCILLAACPDSGEPQDHSARDDGGTANDAEAPTDSPDSGEADGGDAGDVQEDPGMALPEFFRSGSRLHAQVLRAEDGTEIFSRFFDLLLGVTCSFRSAGDGETYCMPDVQESFTPRFDAYLDADCSRPARVEFGACSEEPRFQLLTERGCRPTTRVLRLNPESQGQTWYSLEGSECTPHERLPGQHLYPLGEEVPTSELVYASRELLQGSQLVQERLIGSDGSFLTMGPYDREQGRCGPLRVGEPDDVRCVPLAKRAFDAGEHWFADAACQVRVSFSYRVEPQCESPDVAAKFDLNSLGCRVGGRHALLHALGDPVPQPYERTITDACDPAPASSLATFSFFTMRGAADLGVYPELRAGVMGAGRLRPQVWRSSEEHVLGIVTEEEDGAPVLYDSALDVNCTPVATVDGVLCAPPQATIVYRDADCQDGVLEVYEAEACPLATGKLFSVRSGREYACGEATPFSSVQAYRAGAPVSAPAHRRVRFQGTCVLADSPIVQARYLELGDPLPGP